MTVPHFHRFAYFLQLCEYILFCFFAALRRRRPCVLPDRFQTVLWSFRNESFPPRETGVFSAKYRQMRKNRVYGTVFPTREAFPGAEVPCPVNTRSNPGSFYAWWTQEAPAWQFPVYFRYGPGMFRRYPGNVTWRGIVFYVCIAQDDLRLHSVPEDYT